MYERLVLIEVRVICFYCPVLDEWYAVHGDDSFVGAADGDFIDV